MMDDTAVRILRRDSFAGEPFSHPLQGILMFYVVKSVSHPKPTARTWFHFPTHQIVKAAHASHTQITIYNSSRSSVDHSLSL